MPTRRVFGEQRGEIFGSQAWQPAAPGPSAAVAAPVPVAPPMPYKFAGALVHDGQLQVFLEKGDSITAVRLGDTIEGGYRVESIGEEQITLTYLPIGKLQSIPVALSFPLPVALMQVAADQTVPQPGTSGNKPDRAGAASGAPRRSEVVLVIDESSRDKPAQLLWHGPNEVKLGTQFSVALRVTSSQPVRASPMQIRVNPALLETVAVQPGRFFGEGDRNFSYRISPDGSIFVGAINRNPAPATDAEFVVLTFKPLKAAPAAELSIASLNLQGPAGRVIAFDPLVGFKTAISP